MEIEDAASLLHALGRGINLFLGAGFSVLAADRDGASLPVGNQLSAELGSRFGVDGADSLTLAQLYTVIARSKRDQLEAYVRRRFTVGTLDHRYAAVRRADIATIFTTNVDNLVEQIYADDDRAYINDLNTSGPTYADRRGIDFIHLHGSITDRNRPMRFGTLDVASAFSEDPDSWRYLRNRLARAPTLFWGYSLSDAAALEALQQDSASGGHEAWIQICPADKDSPLLAYYRALGFRVIVADTDQLLNYFAFNLPDPKTRLPRNRAKAATNLLFPDEAIPAPTNVPSRPLVDFFQGYGPGWSDVFSTNLHTISHGRAIVDSIRSHKATIVTGIPGSGKTTLLMQVAASLEFEGHKLILEGPTEAKAESITKLLDNAPAFVCIDDFTNDVDSFGVLQAAPNITLLVADRDYNLSSALHRLNRRDTFTVDITALGDSDLQDLFDSIPASLRRARMKRPETSRGVLPSTFEVVQANVQAQLRDRLREALNQLRTSNPEVAETLLLASYVHSCRTPLSMDMALGYWSGRVEDYSVVYDRIRAAGQLLNEYEGDLAKDDQDYFAARSVLVAETIMDAARGSELNALLTTFYSNVASVRIPAFHVFRRRGYDANLLARAFTYYVDGVRIYDDIYARDRSPYVLQQKALYLARKRRFDLAFPAIEAALSTAARANWTIRSSHARILFEANYDLVAESEEARELVDRAMRILTECYTGDRRRAIHALTFGRLALLYVQRVTDQRAVDYLKQAAEWLAEVPGSEPWMRAALPTLKEVQRALEAVS